jgi:hypothetical protein
MKAGTGNVRVMAANSILDRGWGKPHQTSEVTVTNKRRLLDYTNDELLAIVQAGSDGGADEAEASDAESDSVH